MIGSPARKRLAPHFRLLLHCAQNEVTRTRTPRALPVVSTLMIILCSGIALIVIASLAALVHAVIHAEEGFEDSSGYHRKGLPNDDLRPAPARHVATVDTGNPWDQIEGANCPLGPSRVSAHQP